MPRGCKLQLGSASGLSQLWPPGEGETDPGVDARLWGHTSGMQPGYTQVWPPAWDQLWPTQFTQFLTALRSNPHRVRTSRMMVYRHVLLVISPEWRPHHVLN